MTGTTTSLWPDPNALGPLTDLYQLTMMAGYASAGLENEEATFELFVRRIPKGRNYLVFAGLEQAIGSLLSLRFSPAQIDYLRGLPIFAGVDPEWFDQLGSLRFEGDVWSVPEGTIVFGGEPLLRVHAKLPQAQWVETLLIASLSYTTLVASKAFRVVQAADGRGLYEFGLRRGHGAGAGMLCARAAYLAGFTGTSNVEAARRLGIPAVGTMAHAWVQAFDREVDAFEAFVRIYGAASTLLVDTYDTAEGVRIASRMEPPIAAIRIDSGDLAASSIESRAILDGADRRATRIVVSGDLDEFKVRDLVAADAPIDAFGVGTELITSRDAPALGMVYKLVEMGGKGRIKLSEGKKTYPLAKQIFRTYRNDGTFDHDLVTGADEVASGDELLVPIVRRGKLVAPLPDLDAIRGHAARQRDALPESLRSFDSPAPYTIRYSDLLEDEAVRLGVKPASGGL